MLSVIPLSQISKHIPVLSCIRLCTKEPVTVEKFPVLQYFPYVTEKVNEKINSCLSFKTTEIKCGTIFLCKDGTEPPFVLVFFSQKYSGAANKEKEDSMTQRQMWLACCIRNLDSVKNIKEIVFADAHIRDELAHQFKSMIGVWMTEHPKIKVSVSITDESSDIESVDVNTKLALLDELYYHPDFHDSIRDWVLEKTQVCQCLEKFVQTNNDTLCKKCRETPLNIKTLTWKTSTLSTFVYNMPIEWGWTKFMNECMPKITEISNTLKDHNDSGIVIFPSLSDVFSAFQMVSPQNIRVVLIGQDPYQTPGMATGLAFAAHPKFAIPRSLINIYKELESDGFKPGTTANLNKWAQQGVFLINTALTVKSGLSGSHEEVWYDFTGKLFDYINTSPLPLVIIMWGNKSQHFKTKFSKKHKIITSAHPSPLSAERGFFGSKPFSKTNEFLKSIGKEPIDWNLE